MSRYENLCTTVSHDSGDPSFGELREWAEGDPLIEADAINRPGRVALDGRALFRRRVASTTPVPAPAPAPAPLGVSSRLRN